MSREYDHYNSSDRDRGRSRERRGDYDRRGDGNDRSRSRHNYDEQGRGYDGSRPQGDSYDRRGGGQYEDRRGYDRPSDHGQDRYGRSDHSQDRYGRSDHSQDRYGRSDHSQDRYGRSDHSQDRYGRSSNAGHYGNQGYNQRRDVDSSYGPGSYQDREPHRSRGYSGGGGPPRGGGYGGGPGRGGGGRGGGRGGRGGRGRGPDLSDLQACVTNILKAEITEGFKFFMYAVQAQNSSGEEIVSRYRRNFLFRLGLWDNLLKGMDKNEKNALRNIVFFNGSTFYSGREIPGLEPSNLPFELDFDGLGEGDTMQIVGVTKYVAPIELQESLAPEDNPNEIRFDNRTENGQSFVDQQALLQHSKQTGNQIAVVPTDGKPATLEEFSGFVNSVLQAALRKSLVKWGRDLVDSNSGQKPTGRNGESLGVEVFHAFRCEFSVLKKSNGAIPVNEKQSDPNKASGELALTVDLRAKVLRDKSVLDDLVAAVGGGNPNSYNPNRDEKEAAKRKWIGQTVITKYDKRTYTIIDLDFENSPESLHIENLGINHTQYFQERKGQKLLYPRFKPMITVLGRRNSDGQRTHIHLPAELICGDELDPLVKEKLPMIANFEPKVRNDAIAQVRGFLEQGARGPQGILPGLGIRIKNERYSSRANVLSLPMVLAAGVRVPERYKNMWAPQLAHSNYKIHPKESNVFNVILIHNEKIDRQGAAQVYGKIRDNVNKLSTVYRFSDMPVHTVRAGTGEHHWSVVEQCFANVSNLPRENVYVLDFCHPPGKGTTDPAYSVIKHMLTRHGYISQFVNFRTCGHHNPRDARRSRDILNGVGRQILSKAGVRLWWVQIPRGLPTPSVFVGVDVFHAPKEYDPVTKRRVRKGSCAAIIVQIFREDSKLEAIEDSKRRSTVELYSATVAREGGKEYDLREHLHAAVKTALKELHVNPMSCVVWRDGIGDSAFEPEASQEIAGIEAALREVSLDESKKTPMSYIVCQKGIDTKLFASGVNGYQDGTLAAPPGTLVEGVQALKHHTFYINGRAPPRSTPKPVRFVVVRQDDALQGVSMPELTWNMCHDYPNWTGPIKVPSVCMMAHKLAELAGNMSDSGQSIDNKALTNRVHFL